MVRVLYMDAELFAIHQKITHILAVLGHLPLSCGILPAPEGSPPPASKSIVMGYL